MTELLKAFGEMGNGGQFAVSILLLVAFTLIAGVLRSALYYGAVICRGWQRQEFEYGNEGEDEDEDDLDDDPMYRGQQRL